MRGSALIKPVSHAGGYSHQHAQKPDGTPTICFAFPHFSFPSATAFLMTYEYAWGNVGAVHASEKWLNDNISYNLVGGLKITPLFAGIILQGRCSRLDNLVAKSSDIQGRSAAHMR